MADESIPTSRKRHRKLVALTAAGAIALAGGSLLGTSVASAAEANDSTASSQDQNFVQQRISRIAGALKGLVSNGTITQEQADKVASTLANDLPRGRGEGMGRHGGMGPGAMGMRGEGFGLRLGQDLSVAAQTLGLTEDQLRTELDKGTTLATLAQQKGVNKDTLVNALVEAAKKHLAQEVTEGDLTQAQADQISANLATRIAGMVERGRPTRGDGAGPQAGHGGWGGRGGREGVGPGGPGAGQASTVDPSSSVNS